MLGVAEEITKGLAGGIIKSVPFVGNLIHHGIDRIKDINIQAGINSLKDKSKEYASKIASFTSALSTANSKSEQLHKEPSFLSDEQFQQKEQILAAIEANEQLKSLLTNSVNVLEQNINEVNAKLSDSQKMMEVLHNESLSHAEKLSELETLASLEKERMNQFESSLTEISKNLELQSQQVFESLQRIEFLEEKVASFEEFKEHSLSHAEQIKQLTEKVKALESEKEQREQAKIISEIQELQKQENILLANLQLLESKKELFHSEEGEKSQLRTFGISIADNHWLEAKHLSSIKEKYPLDEKTYDFYFAKYGSYVMRNWIRSSGSASNDSFQDNNSSLSLEWKKNHSSTSQALLSVQSKISAKISLLKNPDLIKSIELPSDYSLPTTFAKIEEDFANIEKERQIINIKEEKISEQINAAENLLSSNTFDWKLLTPSLALSLLAALSYWKSRGNLKNKSNLFFKTAAFLSFSSSLCYSLYQFSSFYSSSSDIKQNVNYLKSSLEEQVEIKERLSINANDLLNAKREEIINLTRVNPEFDDSFETLGDYLTANKYPFTNFLAPVSEQKKFETFADYLSYINSWNKKKKTEDENIFFEINFSSSQLAKIKEKFNSLTGFFMKINYPQFKEFFDSFKKEEAEHLVLKEKYPEIQPTYSDNLLVELNSLSLTTDLKKFCEQIKLIPSQSEFSYWKKEKNLA